MPPNAPHGASHAHAGRRGALALAVVAVVLATGVFATIAAYRPGPERLWGDEGTYIAMAVSLARDGDLRFDEADRQWATERIPGRGATLILQRTDSGIAYSKPPLYPILAAPFVRLFGEAGLVLANVLALAVGLACGWLYLRRIGDSAGSWLTLVTFGVAGVVVPYVVWRMSESLQVGLVLAGSVLVCGALRPSAAGDTGRWRTLLDHRMAPAAGGFLLGLLVSMRFSNAALVGGVLLAVLLARRWRRLMFATIGVVAGFALLLVLSQVMLGAASPYTAERTSFNADLGYPPSDEASSRFDQRSATHRLGIRASTTTLYSTLYFFVGRHTGLLPYFPLALVLLAVVVRSRDGTALALAAGALGLAVFYLLYMPNNFFGGSTFLGNRYFLVAYPVLLVALPRLPSLRTQAVVLGVSLLFGGSAVVSAREARGLSSTSQSHAAAGAFRWLPYESTAVDIQGHFDRFWSKDYVRFTDPWADVKRNHFVLHADRPSAEVLVGSHRPRDTIFFLARSHGGARSLLWSDWRGEGSLSLDSPGGSPPARIRIQPSRPWRRHGFWFGDDVRYDARLLRFDLTGPAQSTAEIYYLADGARLSAGFERHLLSATLPDTANAGEREAIRVRIRNDSRIPWRRRDVLPVTIGYRLEAADGLVAQERRLLPSDVKPGEAIEVDVEVRWPAEPGDYRLVVDLWLHPVRWYADVVGEPLIDHPVRIE